MAKVFLFSFYDSSQGIRFVKNAISLPLIDHVANAGAPDESLRFVLYPLWQSHMGLAMYKCNLGAAWCYSRRVWKQGEYIICWRKTSAGAVGTCLNKSQSNHLLSSPLCCCLMELKQKDLIHPTSSCRYHYE